MAETEIQALINTLDIYAKTDRLVGQTIYQGLCAKAKEALARADKDNERLEKQERAAQSRFETMAAVADKRGIAISEVLELMEPAKKILEQALQGEV